MKILIKTSLTRVTKNQEDCACYWNREDCACYYWFKVDNDGFKLVTFEETHSHELNIIVVNTLTQDIISIKQMKVIMNLKNYSSLQKKMQLQYEK